MAPRPRDAGEVSRSRHVPQADSRQAERDRRDPCPQPPRRRIAAHPRTIAMCWTEEVAAPINATAAGGNASLMMIG